MFNFNSSFFFVVSLKTWKISSYLCFWLPSLVWITCCSCDVVEWVGDWVDYQPDCENKCLSKFIKCCFMWLISSTGLQRVLRPLLSVYNSKAFTWCFFCRGWLLFPSLFGYLFLCKWSLYIWSRDFLLFSFLKGVFLLF